MQFNFLKYYNKIHLWSIIELLCNVIFLSYFAFDVQYEVVGQRPIAPKQIQGLAVFNHLFDVS